MVRSKSNNVFRVFKQAIYFIGVALLLGGSSLGLAQQSNTEFTLGLTDNFSSIFLPSSLTTSNNLSVGFIHLPTSQEALDLDGESKFGISKLTKDTWGYSEEGFQISLNGTSNPYALNNATDNSSDVFLSTSYFQSLDSLTGLSLFENLGLSGFTEVSLQARFNPSFLNDINTTEADVNSPFSAQGYLGYRQSFDTQLPLGTNNILIERISIEPKFEAIYDTELNFGANLSIFADTNLFDSSNLSLGLEGGYTDGFWYNFTINSPVKF